MGANGPPRIDPVDDALSALELFAAAPLALGGVHIRGWHGPRRTALLGWLRQMMARANPQAGARWSILPHHTDPEALDGSVDLSESLRVGRPVLRAGLLEQFQGGVVVLPMAERVSRSLAARLAAGLDAAGFALVILDESLPDEPGPWEGLADRLSLSVDLRDESAWRALDSLAELGHSAPARSASKASLSLAVSAQPGARRDAWQMSLDDRGRSELCRAATLLGIASHRPILQAACVARLKAMADGRTQVSEADLAFALRQVLVPRARQLPALEADGVVEPPHDAGQSPPPDRAADDLSADSAADEPPPGETSEPDLPPDTDQLPDGAAERMVEAALASLPAGLLALLAAGAAVRGNGARAAGAGSITLRGRGRARSIGARRGQPRAGERIHLLATLRAALPWQRLRQALPGHRAPIRLRPDDLHVHREVRRRGTTTVFVVDASGSTALQRLAEAKGAVELLLADCYVRRDRVALVSFRGTGAEVLLAPTRSLVAARRALAALPGGGGSPVAAGLELAARMSEQLVRAGDDVQLVVLTDGRANLSRDGQPGRERAAMEAGAMARQLAPLAAQRVLIDTSVRPEAAAQRLAEALDARYLPMPFARARDIREAIASATR